MDPNELSIKSTQIQLLGTALVALLLWLQLRSLRQPFLVCWAAAWTCLSLALLALVGAFTAPPLRYLGYGAYCFAEYAFGLLLVAGCRQFVLGVAPGGRQLWPLAPLGVVAAALPALAGGDVNTLLVPHAAIVAGFFATAFTITLTGRRGRAFGGGLTAVLILLALLTLDFAQYAVLCAYSVAAARPYLFPHLQYAPLFDMTLEVLLAFSMTMVVTDCLRRELEAANRELESAGRRFRSLAERDPLTDALNRHAFETLRQEKHGAGPGFAGCVVMFDMDNLKPINDTHGHAAGDAAICAVAKAIRGLVRPADFLFRWGGDEFLLIWQTVKEADGRARLERLPDLLAQQSKQANLAPEVALTVSYGVAGFAGWAGLESAIREADQRMYTAKQDSRARRAAGS